MKKFDYSTESEKRSVDRSVQYCYQLKDQTINLMVFQFFSLLALLLTSLFTLRDSFKCTGSFTECENIRRQLVCKADLVSPLTLSFPFVQSQTSNATVSIQCGWESAKSQIRICIVLCSLYATYLAYYGAKRENRKEVESYL